MSALALPPLSVYVHIPWCVQKCPYCDFNSHQRPEQLPEQAYLQALTRDLQAELAAVQGRKISTLFFGGGTPSLFSAQTIGAIIDLLDQTIGFVDAAEITLEANPGTAEAERFAGYRACGVNRLSMGVQSFAAQQLHRLGRIHDPVQALAAVEMAQTAGFERINIDLMHGLPEQTLADARADLQQAFALGVEHISWYQLTIEPNTAFYSAPPVLPVEDILADIQDMGGELLAAQGFQQYEVSAFAKEGGASRHNLNYWRFGDYLGLGAGAHGKITHLASGELVRRWKKRQPASYMDSIDQLAGQSPIQSGQMLLEFSMNALRLAQGVEASLYAERTACELPVAGLQSLVVQGLLEDPSRRLQATPLGYRFLNQVLEQIDQIEPV